MSLLSLMWEGVEWFYHIRNIAEWCIFVLWWRVLVFPMGLYRAFIWHDPDPRQVERPYISACNSLHIIYKLTHVRIRVEFFLLSSPTRAMAASFSRFVDHTQWHTTVGRTPLDEGSVRRRDLYLTTHNTYESQTCMPAAGFERAIPTSEWP